MAVFRAVSPTTGTPRHCVLCKQTSFDDMVVAQEAKSERDLGYQGKARPERVICIECVKGMAEALGLGVVEGVQ